MNDLLNMVFPFFACTFCAGVGLFAGQGYERFRQRCLRNVSLQNIRQLSESLENLVNVCDQETVSFRDQIASLTLDVQTSEAKIASQHCEINRLEEQLAEVQSGNEKLLLASSADGLRIKELEKAYADEQGAAMLAETRAHDASEEASRFRQSLIEVESAATIERQRLGAELAATIADRQVATAKCREQYDGRREALRVAAYSANRAMLAECDRDALLLVLRTINEPLPEPKSGLRVFGELWTLAHSFESDHHV